MFCFSIRWRKASRCKKLIRRVRSRLRLLKKRRVSILNQLREDITQLLTDGSGDHQAASPLVEQLVHGEGLMGAYDLLDHFCELIVIRLSYIRKNKECPNDINEAVSSLIFASSRCGDLPELREIRQLFGAWYGQRFAMVALELLPGNLVNWQVKDKLSLKCVREDEKKRFLEEMIIKYGIKTCPLAIDCISEPQRKQEEDNTVETSRDNEYNEEKKVVIKNKKKSQPDEKRVFQFKTPSLLFRGFHGSGSDDKEKRRPQKRRRKGTSAAVMDMQSTLYYHSCFYQKRMRQKRSSFISNENLWYVLAGVGWLSEKRASRSLNLCYNCSRKEDGRVCGGEIVEAKCNGGGYPSHVHPKLPNWEEFRATFVAMRRAHLYS